MKTQINAGRGQEERFINERTVEKRPSISAFNNFRFCGRHVHDSEMMGCGSYLT